MLSAREAASKQDILQDEDFTLPRVDASSSYKMLLPLGYQFEADVLRYLHNYEISTASVPETVSVDDVILSYQRCINTPPLNTSRECIVFKFSMLFNLVTINNLSDFKRKL